MTLAVAPAGRDVLGQGFQPVPANGSGRLLGQQCRADLDHQHLAEGQPGGPQTMHHETLAGRSRWSRGPLAPPASPRR